MKYTAFFCGGGVFRICLPDYFSPYLKNTCMIDINGNIIFDPTGGGILSKNGIENGGHIWFPNYINVKEILEQTLFRDIDFLCYHTEEGKLVKKHIDFSNGYIIRIPKENEKNKPVYSIVVDCHKSYGDIRE